VAVTVNGLSYGGGLSQFYAQFIGVTVNVIYVGSTGWLMFNFIDKIIGNRVKAEHELFGLDTPEMGVEAYSGVKMDKNSETPLSRYSQLTVSWSRLPEWTVQLMTVS
jgi:ammonium transporter, Amt family